MSCKSAKRTDEYHGWECTITEGPCEFLIPDSKACAEKFGEGPDSHDEETIKMAEERLEDDDGTRYTTEDIMKMRENKDRHEQAIEYFDGYGSPYDDMVIKALKKQIPTKPIMKSWCPAKCPCCGEELSESVGDGYYKHYFSLKVCNCGQKIKWKE